MNYNNFIYIGYSSFISKINEEFIKVQTHSIKKGIIVDNEQFIKDLNTHLKFPLLKKNIKIIYNIFHNKDNLCNIKDIFYSLGYKNVDLLSEINIFSLNKNDNYLIYDQVYKFFYLDRYNQKKSLVLDPSLLSEVEIANIIQKRTKNKNLLIINKNNLIHNLSTTNYYVYDNLCEFFKKLESRYILR